MYIQGDNVDRNHIIIIILVIVIIALAAIIGITFMESNKNDAVIYNNSIEGVGTFNTVNVTNFTISNSSNSVQTDYVANDTIAQITTTSSSSAIDVTISESVRVNDSAEGHTIYKDTATIGEHKGDVRYFSVLKDSDNDRYVFISTDNFNLTSMIVDTFKFN